MNRDSIRGRVVVAASSALVIALGVLAAGCGGGSGSADPAPADPEPAQTGSIAEPGPEPAPSTEPGGEEPFPGTEEFGLTEEEYAAHIEQVQSLIASCMAEAGFEYVPADVQTVAEAQANVRKRGTYDEKKAYKLEWGYDVSTRHENKIKEIELGPQNLAYFDGLSEADQVAYDRTLYGEDPNATFAFTFDEEDFSGTGGCTRKAVEQTFTPEQLTDTYVNPKDVLVENDPRVIEAYANWVSCMEDAGYEGYLDQDDIIDELEEQYEAITEGEDPTTLTGPRAEQLKELQAEEIAVSLVDLDCEQDLDKAVHEVEIEVFGVPVSD